MSMDQVLEERYSTAREAIYRLLCMSSDYNLEVASGYIEVFSALESPTDHGNVMWALMMKTQGIKTGILGLHFKAYMQYYYLYLVSASQRPPPNRAFDLNAQAFLVCTAAFGYTRGVAEFDKAFFAGDAASVDNMIIDKASFLSWFNSTDDQFSFLHSWRVIDRLWDSWDSPNPVLLHGFVTPTLSEKLLSSRSHIEGAFLLRFSSRGGLAVDYIRNGKLEKAHWKFSQLANNIVMIESLLYDQGHYGALLKYLVDTSADLGFNSNVLAKTDVFVVGRSYNPDQAMEEAPINVSYGYNNY